MSDARKGFSLANLDTLVCFFCFDEEKKNPSAMPSKKSTNSAFEKAQKRAIEESNKRDRAVGQVREISRMAQEEGTMAGEAQRKREVERQRAERKTLALLDKRALPPVTTSPPASPTLEGNSLPAEHGSEGDASPQSSMDLDTSRPDGEPNASPTDLEIASHPNGSAEPSGENNEERVESPEEDHPMSIVLASTHTPYLPLLDNAQQSQPPPQPLPGTLVDQQSTPKSDKQGRGGDWDTDEIWDMSEMTISPPPPKKKSGASPPTKTATTYGRTRTGGGLTSRGTRLA